MTDYANIKRGDTFKISAQVVDENGSAVNLTGATLWFTLKRNFTDVDLNAIYQGTIASGAFVITDIVGGFFTLTVPHTATTGLPPNEISLFYDIRLHESNGNVWTLDSGTITYLPDVSLTPTM